ncbi:hypothetical protein [Deinococcus sedimenti]|uniref:Uncharacterized protein n=1 Tax=Deinococcus sedimenti TaxID=1867090 RepID=A0ABQ2RZT7_9DEIO|nr:hypothetical protein [Deinococcus sedimenti]GGR84526.1 hypothetical protein GCM10008960_09440 [Deinococcus sedimenti]
MRIRTTISLSGGALTIQRLGALHQDAGLLDLMRLASVTGALYESAFQLSPDDVDPGLWESFDRLLSICAVGPVPDLSVPDRLLLLHTLCELNGLLDLGKKAAALGELSRTLQRLTPSTE